MWRFRGSHATLDAFLEFVREACRRQFAGLAGAQLYVDGCRPWYRDRAGVATVHAGIVAIPEVHQALEVSGFAGPHWPRRIPADVRCTLRPRQAEAVDAYINGSYLGRGVVQLPTGVGKTRVAWAVAESLGGHWLVMTRGQQLAAQLQREFDELGPGQGAPHPWIHATSYGMATDVQLQAAHGIIVDECHEAATPTRIDVLLRGRAAWWLGLSATPFERASNNLWTCAILGPLVYTMTFTEAVEEGLIVRPVLNDK